MPEVRDEPGRPFSDRPTRDRVILIGALLSGLGSGVFSVLNTQDRYYGSTAERDLALRDIRIEHLEEADIETKDQFNFVRQELVSIRKVISELPPDRTQNALNDMEQRLRQVERATHTRGSKQ